MDLGRQKCHMSTTLPIGSWCFEDTGPCYWTSSLPRETREVLRRLPVSPLGLKTQGRQPLCTHVSRPIHRPSLSPSSAVLEDGRSPAVDGERWRGVVYEWEAGCSSAGCSDIKYRDKERGISSQGVSRKTGPRVCLSSTSHTPHMVRGLQAHG